MNGKLCLSRLVIYRWKMFADFLSRLLAFIRSCALDTVDSASSEQQQKTTPSYLSRNTSQYIISVYPLVQNPTTKLSCSAPASAEHRMQHEGKQ